MTLISSPLSTAISTVLLMGYTVWRKSYQNTYMKTCTAQSLERLPSPLWWRNSWPPIPSHHDQFCSRFLKILLFSPLYELSRRPDVCILCSEPMSFPSPMLGMTSLSIYNSSFEKVVNIDALIDDMKNERDYNFLPCLARYLKWRECPQSHRLKLWQSQQMIKDIYYEKETE